MAPDPEQPPGPAPASRLFLALWPDAATRRALAAWRDACGWPAGARPTPDERLHLTLHFIGSVPRERVPALADAFDVDPGCNGAPVELRLDRVAVWPNGVAVLLPAHGTMGTSPAGQMPQPRPDPPPIPAALQALHDRLAVALSALALPLDTRPYQPHVSLARRARGARLPDAGGAPPPVVWRAHGHVLAESDRGYHVLRRYGATSRTGPPRR